MVKLRTGDLIRLKNVKQYQINQNSDKVVNIFQILEIDSDYVVLVNCKGRIPSSDIEPIPMNGIDDSQIYCHHEGIMATYVEHNGSAPERKTDYSYYLDGLKRTTRDWDKRNYYELITEQGLQYVHEVQHFLNDKNSRIKLIVI